VTEDWLEPGNKLRAAREAKGLSLPDVSHQTRIPRKVIEALEQDDYGSFPSPTYAKSFLTQYAGFVGVDPSQWLDFFEPVVFNGADDVLSIVEPMTPYEPRPAAATQHGNPPSRSHRHSIMPTLMLIAVTGGLAYGAVKGFILLNGLYGDKPTAKQDASAGPSSETQAQETALQNRATASVGKPSPVTTQVTQPDGSSKQVIVPRAIIVPLDNE